MLERILLARVEVWLVGLLLVLAAIGTLLFGALVKFSIEKGDQFGGLGAAAVGIAGLPVDAKNALDELAEGHRSALLAYEQRFDGVDGFAFDYAPGTRPDAGYLVLSRYDGDLGRSVAELVDLDAQTVLHRWQPDFDAIRGQFDVEHALPGANWADPAERVRMIHPMPTRDGGLIYQNDSPLVKLDACGSPVWVAGGIFHHSIESLPDGGFWAPSYDTPSTLPRAGEEYEEDLIVEMGPDGTERFRKSVQRMLIENGYDYLVYGAAAYLDDPLHLNDIQPVLADGPYWQQGDVFVSLRNISTVLLYRPSEDRVVWLKQWPWMNQHDVDILDDRRISIFDNRMTHRPDNRQVVDGHNDVKIYDFASGTVSSPWAGAMAARELRTIQEGRSEILSDDAVFLEETNFGRLIRLRRDGGHDWQFVNRAADGQVYLVNWARMIGREEGAAIWQAIRAAGCAGTDRVAEP